MAYILKLRKTPEAMIHHSVGRRSKPSADVPTAGTGCVSLAPRRGSSSISNVGTSTSAGAAATTMAARQPCACASGPLEKYASAPPNGTPNMNNASTRERLSAGKRSEEHTSELQSLRHLVCRLLLEKKTRRGKRYYTT